MLALMIPMFVCLLGGFCALRSSKFLAKDRCGDGGRNFGHEHSKDHSSVPRAAASVHPPRTEYIVVNEPLDGEISS